MYSFVRHGDGAKFPQNAVTMNWPRRLRARRPHSFTAVLHIWPQYFLVIWPFWPPDSIFIQRGGSLQSSRGPLILAWPHVSVLHCEVRSRDRLDPRPSVLTSLQDTEAGHNGGGENKTGTISECLHQSEAEWFKARYISLYISTVFILYISVGGAMTISVILL